jgi:hypothetical protein
MGAADDSDRAMNIRAARAEHLDGFTIAGNNRAHANRYEATPSGVIDDLLLEVEGDLSEHVFVDLGSGKGRVLCLAAKHPFKRIIGVEFAAELHRIAVENLARFRVPWRKVRDIRPLLLDAVLFEPPPEPLVVFMFNPFREPILGRVVENLERSLDRAPQPIWILYYMPEHAHVIDRSDRFVPKARARDWIVYRSR